MKKDLLEALRTIIQLKKMIANDLGLEQRVFAYKDVMAEIDSIQEMQGNLDGKIAALAREKMASYPNLPKEPLPAYEVVTSSVDSSDDEWALRPTTGTH